MVKKWDQYHEINYKQYLCLIKEEPQEGVRLNRRDEKVKSSCGFGYFLTYHVQPWGSSCNVVSVISNSYKYGEGERLSYKKEKIIINIYF